MMNWDEKVEKLCKELCRLKGEEEKSWRRYLYEVETRMLHYTIDCMLHKIVVLDNEARRLLTEDIQ